MNLIIGKKGVTRSKMKKSIKHAYQDLFNEKVANGGMAPASAQKLWEARMKRIAFAALQNGFDPLPLFSGVVQNTIRGVKEGNKGKIWNAMGELNEEYQTKADKKRLLKKTKDTMLVKKYVDNLTQLLNKIKDSEIKEFNKAGKKIDFQK